MAKTKKQTPLERSRGILGHAWRWALIAVSGLAGFLLFLIVLWSVINPPTTAYMISQSWRHSGVQHQWTALENMSPHIARSVVAAEDANFCQHWGFDIEAIKRAIADGGDRGASTLTQPTVKNVFLWHGRSYPRKVLEAVMTPVVEAVWTKRRIVEVYLNVAEFDRGVFGVHAASQRYFGTTPDKVTAVQAARLAAILPAPQERSAAKPSKALRKRAAAIMDGSATIGKDGRSICFES